MATENILRTVYGAYVQTTQLLGIPFQMFPNTTLNEKLSIASGVTPTSQEVPRMRYWCIGNGGHTLTVAADNTPIPMPVQHRSTDAAPYKMLPFVLRDPAADLTILERANYCLRKAVVINGTRYIAYYGKRFDVSTVQAIMKYVAVRDGVETITQFVPDSSNLSPVPPDWTSTGVNVTKGDYVMVSALANLLFGSVDRDELINVANIMFNNQYLAIISEICLFTGVDKVIQSPGPGSTTVDFNDVIAAQICSFVNSMIPLAFASDGITENLDVGATEPLFMSVPE